MKNFEEVQITKITHLKRPTIYFYLKQNGFSENYIRVETPYDAGLINSVTSIVLKPENVSDRQ